MSHMVSFPVGGRDGESRVPIAPVYYDLLLDHETLRAVTKKFQALHPDLLPIVIVRAMRESWFGDLTPDQIKQALRDCYDMTARCEELFSPVNFVRNRMSLCLENQTLPFLQPSPEEPTPLLDLPGS